ncbi:MAG TPA: hypothetical protein VGR61_00095 [Candidatus Dormibacteraeota bacterium]|nr:hypothetical protein [Candidatus Dormibacteraeota bacterium]
MGRRQARTADRDRRHLFLGASFLALALGALALVRGPLLYDGSFFLYQVLQTGAPFIPDNRIVAVPIHLLTLFVARFTDDTWTIALAFSGLYIALATGSYLGAAWWIQRRLGRLLAWPILGLLAVSPILVDATTESLVTGGLAFPMVYLAAAAKSVARLAAAAILGLVLFASHPAAGLVLSVAAAAAAYRWLRYGRRDHVELLFGLVALCAGVLRLRLLVPGYETYIADPATLATAMSHGITYPVAIMVLSVWLAGAGLLLCGLNRLDARVARWLPALPLAGALPVAASLLLGTGWPSALDYRLAIVPVLLPLLVMLVIDVVRDAAPPPAVDTRYQRAAALTMIAIGVCVGLQTWRWNGDVSAMRTYVSASTGPCIADVTGSDKAISNWGGRSLAVLIQGRRPRVVLGSVAECQQLVSRHLYSGSNHFVALYPSHSGWFHLPSP